MSNKSCCFCFFVFFKAVFVVVVKLYSYSCVAGFKAGLIFFFPYHSVFTGFHCPLCSNVDEWLHTDVCTTVRAV